MLPYSAHPHNHICDARLRSSTIALFSVCMAVRRLSATVPVYWNRLASTLPSSLRIALKVLKQSAACSEAIKRLVLILHVAPDLAELGALQLLCLPLPSPALAAPPSPSSYRNAGSSPFLPVPAPRGFSNPGTAPVYPDVLLHALLHLTQQLLAFLESVHLEVHVLASAGGRLVGLRAVRLQAVLEPQSPHAFHLANCLVLRVPRTHRHVLCRRALP